MDQSKSMSDVGLNIECCLRRSVDSSRKRQMIWGQQAYPDHPDFRREVDREFRHSEARTWWS